ncbi:MAG: M20/M25/M40 family metallo-hydrolase [bacterium]|nr:M20/M25/M40 family metallo-hydrolase [bacterium]
MNTQLNLFKSLALILLATGLSCDDAHDAYLGAESINQEQMMEHIEELSSDTYMGRGTGTEGEQMSVDYLVKELKAMGVSSGVEDGTYVQPFPLVGQQSSNHTLNVGNNEASYFDDFVAWPAGEQTEIDIENAELAYVGYGIQAPEENWDDFKGLDVEGKILIIKNNDPGYSEDLFGGSARLYYGRWSYKFQKAKEMGALGAIIIHTDETAGYGWNVVSNSWSRERFNVKSTDASSVTELSAWITYEFADQVFNEVGLNLDELLAAADDPDFEPVSLGDVRLDASLNATYRTINAKNVIGKIEGSDPKLKDEYLILTAHFDHLGVTTPLDGDDINNGAEDNAAGVSALLEMMRAFKSQQENLKRSVIGLIVSAEEVGLLGSKFWAENPTVNPAQISANINLDGMNVYGYTNDVVLIGYGRNTITELVEKHAQNTGRVVVPDPNPELGLFYRSDHFNMAKVGIPAIFPIPGSDFVGKDEAFSAMIDSVSAANYHTVNDEINEYWDLSGAVKDTRLFYKVGVDILNAYDLQQWYPGDEFEATRLTSLNSEL